MTNDLSVQDILRLMDQGYDFEAYIKRRNEEAEADLKAEAEGLNETLIQETKKDENTLTSLIERVDAIDWASGMEEQLNDVKSELDSKKKTLKDLRELVNKEKAELQAQKDRNNGLKSHTVRLTQVAASSGMNQAQTAVFEICTRAVFRYVKTT